MENRGLIEVVQELSKCILDTLIARTPEEVVGDKSADVMFSALAYTLCRFANEAGLNLERVQAAVRHIWVGMYGTKTNLQ